MNAAEVSRSDAEEQAASINDGFDAPQGFTFLNAHPVHRRVTPWIPVTGTTDTLMEAP